MIYRISLNVLALLSLAGCGRGAPCARCDVIVIAATGEPHSPLPALVVETVGRDISDQIYERLADLTPGGASIDASAYQPRLADRWERVDPVTLRFHLRPRARWHDGQAVTAADVVFSFDAFADTLLDTPARAALGRIADVTAEDSATVQIRFSEVYPEQLYDATWHVRIFPGSCVGRPRAGQLGERYRDGPAGGSGPYRIARWERGQSVTLVADTVGGRRTRVGTAIWRFAADPEAALNLVLAREADLLETVGSPERVARIEADSGLRALRYPAAVYGYLGYQMAGRQTASSPLAARAVRQALNLAVDRAALATTAYGPGSKAPPGPMSQLLWIWDDSIAVLPYDTVRAARILTEAGWTPAAEGMRRKDGRALTLDILVPSTSPGRRRLAEVLQEQWRQVGAAVTITAVDFPVLMERLGQGKFESYIGAWLNEPSPRSLTDQWTASGIGGQNFGRYANPQFDRLVQQAGSTEDPAPAGWSGGLRSIASTPTSRRCFSMPR